MLDFGYLSSRTRSWEMDVGGDWVSFRSNGNRDVVEFESGPSETAMFNKEE
jgi:hypothetical protein